MMMTQLLFVHVNNLKLFTDRNIKPLEIRTRSCPRCKIKSPSNRYLRREECHDDSMYSRRILVSIFVSVRHFRFFSVLAGRYSSQPEVRSLPLLRHR